MRAAGNYRGSFFMFDLCRHTIIPARTTDTYFIASGALKKCKKIGSDIAADIEPSATYLVAAKTIRNTAIENTADKGASPKNTP